MEGHSILIANWFGPLKDKGSGGRHPRDPETRDPETDIKLRLHKM